MNDARHNVKERELRESGSITNTRICFEVRATALSPPSHKRSLRLHRTSHKWNLHRGNCNYKVRSTQLLPPTQPSLHKRQGTTQITSILRGIGTQPNNKSTSHQRDQAQSHTNTITSILRGIPTQPPQSPLRKRDTNNKEIRFTTQGDHKDHKLNLF